MNFPRRDLADDDLVRGREEIGRAGMFSRERPEDELRHGHVGGRLDSVPGDVAEHHGERAVAELEEVVDVAADVDARRRLVHLADVETLELRVRARQQRAAHGVGELLLLLVETPVVDRERSLCGDRERRIQRFARNRPSGVEGDERQRSDHLAGRRNRNDRRGRALLQERGESRCEPPSSFASFGVSSSGRRVRNSRRIGTAFSVCGRVSAVTAASPRRTSETNTARSSSSSPRASGIRITAASTPSSSTELRASASSVVLSDRLCANDSETS